jgi:hypothetical protein
VESTQIVAVAVVIAAAVIVLVLRQRGVLQRSRVELSAFGAKASVQTSVQAELDGVKAGRDIKVIAGDGDPARIKNAEAGRDIVRDTTRHSPKG